MLLGRSAPEPSCTLLHCPRRSRPSRHPCLALPCQQVLQTEADNKAGKAIARYIYSAFNDATGEPTADANPLLRRGRTKLSATNPLL